MYPRLIHLYGPLWIQSYGVMIAVGFLVFLYLSLQDPRRKKLISKENYISCVFTGLISGLIGGRALYVIANIHEFRDHYLEIFFPWIGGLAVGGSIIGVIVGTALHLKHIHVPIRPMFDLAAPYGPLMQSIARIGCLLAGCCHGSHAPHALFTITFRNHDAYAPLGIPLHPTQIYMSLLSFIIFIILYYASSKLYNRTGSIFTLYLTLECAARFGIDFLRGDRDPIWGNICGGITISYLQLVSLAGLIASLLLFCLFMISSSKKNE